MANISSSNGLKGLTPQLRFQGFSNEWRQDLLCNVFSKINQRNTNGEIKNVICNSAQRGLIPQREYFDKDIANSDNANGYYIIKQDDFVYNPRKSVSAPYGPISVYKYSKDGIVSPLYLCFRSNEAINVTFYEWYFKAPVWHRYIYLYGDSGVRHDRVSIKDAVFFEMPLHIPNKAEQQKIADFLSLFEKKIQKQRQLIELLKSYKRGLSTALFTQKIKIKKDDGTLYQKWEKCTLGDIFSERIERANGNESLLAVTINNGVVNRSDLELKDNSSKDKTNYKVVRKNDLAYNTMRMWQGACGVSSFDGIVSPAYTVVYVKNNESNYTPFWGYYFKEISMQHIFQKNSQGLTSDTWNLKFDKFASIIVLSPTKSEQMHIATLLDYLSRKIGKHEEKLSKLQAYKNALLNKMFI